MFLSDIVLRAPLQSCRVEDRSQPTTKDLVNQKNPTAEELYRFMVEQFHQSRAFVLELMVVIILIIDLVWLFKGSTPI